MQWLAVLLFSFCVYLFVNRLISGKFINGLFVSLIFPNSIIGAVVFDLFLKSEVPFAVIFHYLFINLLLTSVVILLYKRAIVLANRKSDINTSLKIAVNYYWLLMALTIFNIIMFFLNVDSSSGAGKITFQDAQWYSFVRLFTTFIGPFSILAIFLFITGHHYWRAFGLLSLYILSSILSGSRSGFIFVIIGGLLVYRDLFGIPKNDVFLLKKIVIAISFIGLINFYYMGMDFEKIMVRLLFTAEDSIMVYASPEPTLACASNSQLSNIHRGIARLAGDTGALNFDTLYGIALSNIFYGEGSTTGPTATIGAYVYCAYPGWLIVVFAIIVSIYLALLWFIFRLLIYTSDFFKVFGVPLFLYSVVHAATDYNNMMSAITGLIILMGVVLIRNVIHNCCSKARNNIFSGITARPSSLGEHI